MSTSSSISSMLPGRLGNPNRTLATDPRLDPRLVAAVAGMDAALGEPMSVGPASPYAEILDYIGAVESELDPVCAETLAELAPRLPDDHPRHPCLCRSVVIGRQA